MSAKAELFYDFESQMVIKNGKPFPFMCLLDADQKFILELIKRHEEKLLEEHKKFMDECPF